MSPPRRAHSSSRDSSLSRQWHEVKERHHLETFTAWLQQDISCTTTRLINKWPCWHGVHLRQSLHGNDTRLVGIHSIQGHKTISAQTKNSSVRIYALDSTRKKDTYYCFIEKIWELEYGPLIISLFKCKWE